MNERGEHKIAVDLQDARDDRDGLELDSCAFRWALEDLFEGIERRLSFEAFADERSEQ